MSLSSPSSSLHPSIPIVPAQTSPPGKSHHLRDDLSEFALAHSFKPIPGVSELETVGSNRIIWKLVECTNSHVFPLATQNILVHCLPDKPAFTFKTELSESFPLLISSAMPPLTELMCSSSLFPCLLLTLVHTSMAAHLCLHSSHSLSTLFF